MSVSVPSPGTYTFEVTNDSDIVHSLEVEGHGAEAVTGDIAPGATATLEVEVEAECADVRGSGCASPALRTASWGRFLRGFGQDADGERYVLVKDRVGPVGDTGQVLKMVPPDGPSR